MSMAAPKLDHGTSPQHQFSKRGWSKHYTYKNTDKCGNKNWIINILKVLRYYVTDLVVVLLGISVCCITILKDQS